MEHFLRDITFCLVAVHLQSGADAAAARLVGAIQAGCDAIEGKMSAEELAAFEWRAHAAEAALGETLYRHEFASGEKMSLDDAVALALRA